jgi:plastocyanin
MVRFAFAIIAIVAVLLVGPAVIRADAFDVDITDYAFTPADLTVHVGEPVTWTNSADRDHTVTSDEGELDSENIGPGEAYGHVFETPGKVEYHCTIHPDRMQATITVLAATPAPSRNGTPEPTPPTGTLPPNFSPFPSVGPVETAPTATTAPVATEPPASGATGDSGPGALILIAVLVGLVAAAAVYLASRRRPTDTRTRAERRTRK